MRRLTAFWVLIVGILFISGCSNQAENNARMLYDAAERHSESREYEKAIELLQRIQIDYMDTEIAGLAEKEIDSLQNLQLMLIDNQRTKIAQKFMRIALALDNYKLRYLAYPLTLKNLDKLPANLIPEVVDEWSNPIFYRAYSSPGVLPHLPDNYALASFGKDGLSGGKGLDQDRFYQNGKEVPQLALP